MDFLKSGGSTGSLPFVGCLVARFSFCWKYYFPPDIFCESEYKPIKLLTKLF
jgi:hypothetical protein